MYTVYPLNLNQGKIETLREFVSLLIQKKKIVGGRAGHEAGFVRSLGGNFGRIDYSCKQWRGWDQPSTLQEFMDIVKKFMNGEDTIKALKDRTEKERNEPKLERNQAMPY